MRAAIENWLLGHWYSDRRPPYSLRLLEPLYRFAFKHRQNTNRSLYRPSSPLIVVGNITAGGTGKTPLVIALCDMASKMGLKAGIATTGYGRQGRETMLVKADDDPLECGDEAVLLAQRSGIPVAVAAKRTDAVELLDDLHLDLLVSDDGLQQANLVKDLEICVIDGSRGLGNGHLIPAGPLRESSDRLKQVDCVVSNGKWSGQPAGLKIYQMRIQSSDICSLDGSRILPVASFLNEFSGSTLHAVAGIGNPRRFFDLLSSLGMSTQNHAFADHHYFRLQDFAGYDAGSVIIMTEKDAVKCRLLGLENAYYLSINAHLANNLEQKLREHINEMVKKRT